MDEKSQSEQQTAEKKQQGEGNASRLMVTGGFILLGKKIGLLGTIADANELLKGENVSFGKKLLYSIDGTLIKKWIEKAKFIIETENRTGLSGKIYAGAKAAKYGTITTLIGGAIGGVIGWQRGGRIKDWHDIFAHPWESTKIIFAAEDPQQQNLPNKTTPKSKSAPIDFSEASEAKSNSKNWGNYTTERAQNSKTAQEIAI